MLEFFSFLLLATWIFFELCMLTRYRAYKTSDSFDRTAQEDADLSRAQREAASALQNLNKAQNKISSLRQKGKNLRRNKSGEYDNRSTLGKKLNKEIRHNQAREIRYQNDWLAAESMADDLLKIPSLRAIPWIRTEAYRLSSRLTIICFSVVTCISFFVQFDQGGAWFTFLLLSFWTSLYFLSAAAFKKSLSKKLGI